MARGPEGWEWVRVQEEACPFCGFCAAAVPPEQLGRLFVGEADMWRRFLATEEAGVLRTYPSPGVWSPLEYAAHTRDMLRVFAGRVVRASIEDNPDLPWFEHDAAAVAERYNEQEPVAVAADLVARAREMAMILDTRLPEHWARPAVRDGSDAFTVAGLARFALHETHHHLLDANGTLRS